VFNVSLIIVLEVSRTGFQSEGLHWDRDHRDVIVGEVVISVDKRLSGPALVLILYVPSNGLTVFRVLTVVVLFLFISARFFLGLDDLLKGSFFTELDGLHEVFSVKIGDLSDSVGAEINGFICGSGGEDV
jgi:hypothetical protein